MIAPPYTARQCPECHQWVYCAAGPFAEGDRTKTIADFIHWAGRHAPVDPDATVVGFPYFAWNTEPVTIEEDK